MKRFLTMFLALTLGLMAVAPANAAGLFGWLTGEPDPTEVPAMAEAPTVVTLPPADALFDAAPTAPAAEPVDAPSPTPTATPAPIPDADIEDDGLLRVDLRSLGNPAQLHLTLAGVYAVESDPGFRFERGTVLTLSAAGDRVYLAVGGLTLDMGQSLTLTRHYAPEGEENGIYIEESEKDTLYCGDLAVTAQGDSLRSVLTIPVEDYLYGVVGYEMSDSFPLEALKAQAVAARTYALGRKALAKKRDYDVVDTTADQVYKGYDPEYVNVVLAVDETLGVVGLYEGKYGNCFFTASNGGQTALASQTLGSAESDVYLAMQDDPYDLENPRSLQNELTVTAKGEGSEALKGMLEAALGEALATEGYGEGEWELDSIASVEPVNPRFEGSRLYDGLEFRLRARLLAPVATPEPTETPAPTATASASVTAKASAEATATVEATEAPGATDTPAPTEIPREWVLSEATYAVTLDVFSQIKDGLGLGLNGGDYELIDVETEMGEDGQAAAFTLIMRRFGHGVGMSQRGAQWMAGHYGMGWREILAFYYPGLTLARLAWPDLALTRLEALPAGVGAARPDPTPTPSPAPLPALREGEHYAKVTATSLNVRERPTTSSQILDQLPKGRRVIVASAPDADGWVSIRTGEGEGFVKEEYLETD